MKVIDLETARKKREAHLSGNARCLSCNHEWIAAAPVGTTWLECPGCSLFMGRYVEHIQEQDCMHWHCLCGCDLFYVTEDGCYCPVCGTEQNF